MQHVANFMAFRCGVFSFSDKEPELALALFAPGYIRPIHISTKVRPFACLQLLLLLTVCFEINIAGEWCVVNE